MSLQNNKIPNKENAIAIIGMSGRFPDAKNIDVFWENLCKGKESISSFTDAELIQNGVSRGLFDSSSYVRARGILENIENFDTDFFSIPHMEAQLMDPQHRLFLECSWEALENAGYDSTRFAGKIGVFVGASRSTYFLHHLLFNPGINNAAEDPLCRIGNENDCLATRVSYKLNLKGPSLSVQTACSSSLVSVCLACDSLRNNQCNMAIAGGVSIFSPQQRGYTYQKDMIFSPDGHCRPFDDRAQGTVPGNGVGAIVLKRLEDAITDQDHIYAVIRGYAINNDGHEKMGFSAPSISGQAAVIAAALEMSGFEPNTIGYVEAHGTGTAIGDPVEIAALSKVFGSLANNAKMKRYIGSVKGNIGHLMEASGIAGLIKAVLVLRNKKIPSTLHFTKINRYIDLQNAFCINSDLEEWNQSLYSFRAGVSSFGFGGTNAHVILEESPKLNPRSSDESVQILPISAKTPQALETLAFELGTFLQNSPQLSLSDIAYTLQMGRKEWKYRKAFVCNDIQQAISFLLKQDPQVPTNQYPTKLDLLVESWTSGAYVDWEKLHVDKKPNRIPLPSYPFEKRRCWIDIPKESIAESKQVINFIPQEVTIEEIEEKLVNIWKRELGCEQIDLHDDFFNLGGESLLVLKILSQIEKTMNVVLSLQSFYKAPTIKQLAQLIYSKTTTDDSNITQLKRGNSTSFPLFLIHPIEGTIFCYTQLVQKINIQGPIFGISAEVNEKSQTVEEIAKSYIEKIQDIQKSGPYFLFGASFGGLVAYEIAQQLKKQGDTVAMLGMLDVINPTSDIAKRDSFRDLQISLLKLLENSKNLPNNYDILTDEEVMKRIESLIGLNLLPKEQRERMKAHIIRHLHMIQEYQPELYNGEIIFFQVNDQFHQDKKFWTAWNDLAKQGIKLIHLEGNHLNVLKNPYNDVLVRNLETYMKNVIENYE